ncbi:hypothetical protein [Metabacillus sp. B2-18]|uniref:hypothetical protein n=1 Tax=Metabacillus sp. B2-18 TaxID=2897333 RepID=UPI001E5F39F9|nr:hypothetical protein [Metabacillus sp. B2-18]UGB30490.1 hypothetical protein LPC09_22790 [Metabacillus sp. B2-18]
MGETRRDRIQWYRVDNLNGDNRVAIEGATDEKYTPTSSDVRKYVSAEVTLNHEVISSDLINVSHDIHFLTSTEHGGPRVTNAILAEGNRLVYIVKSDHTDYVVGEEIPVGISEYEINDLFLGINQSTPYLYVFEVDQEDNIAFVWDYSKFKIDPNEQIPVTDLEKINQVIVEATGDKIETLKLEGVNEELIKELADLLTKENLDVTPIGSLIADADGEDEDDTVSEEEFAAFFTGLDYAQVVGTYTGLKDDQKAVLAKLKEIYPTPTQELTDLEKINQIIVEATGDKIETLKLEGVNEELIKELADLLTKENLDVTPIGSLIADADGEDEDDTVSEEEFAVFFTGLDYAQVVGTYTGLKDDQKAVLAKLKEIYPTPTQELTDLEKINQIIVEATGDKIETLKLEGVNEELIKELADLLTKENLDVTPIGSLIADADGEDEDDTVSEEEFAAFFTGLDYAQVVGTYTGLKDDQKAVLAKLKEIYPTPTQELTDLEKINQIIVEATGDKIETLKLEGVNEELIKELADLLTKENLDVTPIGSLIADADGEDEDDTVSEEEFAVFFTGLDYAQVVGTYTGLKDDQKAVLAKLKEIYPTPTQDVQAVAFSSLNMGDTFIVEDGIVKFI